MPHQSEKDLLIDSYDAFNRRDIDAVLKNMDINVDWPNGMEGGREHGHAAVRSYWQRQWSMINPNVGPTDFQKMDDGRIDVTVHQVVKDMSGNVLIDEMVHHIYTIDNDLITHMEIKK